MPFMLLLLLPAFEIYGFIKIGEHIGAWAVLVWLAAAIFLGMNILRYLGATAMLDAARQLQAGDAPAQTLMDAFVKAIAAVLLIIPGFFSDVIALLLFIPPIRHLLLKRWLRKFSLKTEFSDAGFSAKDAHGDGNVYEHDESLNTKFDVIDGQLSKQVLEHKSETKKTD